MVVLLAIWKYTKNQVSQVIQGIFHTQLGGSNKT